MKRLTFCIILLITSSLLAQEINSYFEHYSYERGLNNTTITAITMDKNGILWLGTADGLNRFDGFRFTPYDRFSKTVINGAHITALYVDKDNSVWIGTKKGEVWRYDQKRDVFTKITLQIHVGYQARENIRQYEVPEFENNSITAIAGNAEGKIFIGSRDAGLFILQNSSATVQTHLFLNPDEPGIPGNFVTAIAVQDNKRVFVSCYAYGIVQLVYNSAAKDFSRAFSIFPVEERREFSDSKVKHITSMHIADNKNLYAGDVFGNMFKMNYGENKFHRIGGILEDQSELGRNKLNKVNNIHSIAEKVFYITEFQGVCSIDDNGNKANTVDLVDGRTYNRIPAIPRIFFVDRNQNVWIAADNNSGLYRLKLNANRLVPLQQNIRNITAVIHVDKENYLFSSRGNGLFKFNMNTGATEVVLAVNESTQEFLKHIRILYQDSRGAIWIGTANGKVFIMSALGSKADPVDLRYSENASHQGFAISDIIEDNSGAIWIATSGGGLYRVVRDGGNKKAEHFLHSNVFPNTIPHDDIQKLVEYKGKVYVMCRGNIFSLYNPKSKEFVEFTFEGLPRSGFQLITRSGVWIAYYENGDCFQLDFERKIALRYDPLQGFPDLRGLHSYHQIMTTTDGVYLWNANNRLRKMDISFGGVNLEPSATAPVAFDSNKTIIGTADGLFALNTTSFGDFPFATIQMVSDGINGFLTPGDSVYFENNPSKISLTFSISDIGSASVTRFAYKLPGQPWAYLPYATNILTIDKLNQGANVIQYKILGFGINSIDKVNTFTIIVDPPFWKKHIFWGSFVLITVIIICVGYLMHSRQTKKIERLQKGLAADLHDNIGAGLTEITLLTEVVKMNKGVSDSAAEKLTVIGSRAAELVDSMSDIVWLINPKKLLFDEIILRLKRSFVPVCESKHISLSFNYPNALSHAEIKTAILQNIYLFIKEAVNNAIKHANATEIHVAIGYSKRTFSMSITDNGTGFDTKIVGFGNGLRTMHDRAENLGGELQIRKSGSGGTEISCIFSI